MMEHNCPFATLALWGRKFHRRIHKSQTDESSSTLFLFRWVLCPFRALPWTPRRGAEWGSLSPRLAPVCDVPALKGSRSQRMVVRCVFDTLRPVLSISKASHGAACRSRGRMIVDWEALGKQ
jgi:hypothetical protein